MAKKQGNLKKLRMDKVHSGTNYNVIFVSTLSKTAGLIRNATYERGMVKTQKPSEVRIGVVLISEGKGMSFFSSPLSTYLVQSYYVVLEKTCFYLMISLIFSSKAAILDISLARL